METVATDSDSFRIFSGDNAPRTRLGALRYHHQPVRPFDFRIGMRENPNGSTIQFVEQMPANASNRTHGGNSSPDYQQFDRSYSVSNPFSANSLPSYTLSLTYPPVSSLSSGGVSVGRKRSDRCNEPSSSKFASVTVMSNRSSY